MELYKLYIKERENAELYSDDKGFFTYNIYDDTMKVTDIFIKKEFRGLGIGREFSNMIDNIAKENNCMYIHGIICTRDKSWKNSFEFQKKMGYKFLTYDNLMITLKKEL